MGWPCSATLGEWSSTVMPSFTQEMRQFESIFLAESARPERLRACSPSKKSCLSQGILCWVPPPRSSSQAATSPCRPCMPSWSCSYPWCRLNACSDGSLVGAGAFGWCGGRRFGERRVRAGKGGRDQRDAQQVLGSHLQSFSVVSGSGANGCTADRSARWREVWQPAPKPPLATVSIWPSAEFRPAKPRTGHPRYFGRARSCFQ